MPVVGISMYRAPASWGTWSSVEADLLPAAYAASVEAVGGVALLVPPIATAAAASAVVSALDALIVAGGEDVNPARYGQQPHRTVTSWNDARDVGELLLLDAADAARLPVLGICRGMQVMAVHRGGTLVQHLADTVGHGRHAASAGTYADTEVSVVAGTEVGRLLPASLVVASHHHQAVAEHPGYRASAWDDDGVLQAMEASGDRFEVAVQWHPEQRPDEGLFTGLIAAARGDGAISAAAISAAERGAAESSAPRRPGAASR